MLPSDDDLEARLLAGRALALEGPKARAEALLEAHRRFAGLGMSAQAASIGFGAAGIALGTGELNWGLSVADEVMRYAREHGQRFTEENTEVLSRNTLMAMGRLDDHDQLADLRRDDLQWFAAASRAWREELAGNLDSSMENLPAPTADVGPPIMYAPFHGARTRVLANAGHLKEASSEFALMRAAMEQVLDTTTFSGVAIVDFAMSHLDEGFRFVADEEFRSAIREWLSEGVPVADTFFSVSGRSAHRLFADLAFEVGLHEVAERLYEQGA